MKFLSADFMENKPMHIPVLVSTLIYLNSLQEQAVFETDHIIKKMLTSSICQDCGTH